MYKWKYKTYKVVKGKYDGAILRIPEFFENAELYSPKILEISPTAFVQYVNFYIDVLTLIFGYDTVKMHPKARKEVLRVADVRRPTWLGRFLKKSVRDHDYVKGDFKDDQLNQLAIIIGLQCVVANMTPYNNKYLEHLLEPLKDSSDDENDETPENPLNLSEG